MEKKYSKKGPILLFITAVIWGSATVTQVIGADSMTPFYFNFSRYLLGALSVIPLILILEKKADDKKTRMNTLKVGILAGIALFGASIFQQFGFTLTDSAGKGGFITSLYMVLVPVFGIFLGNKTGIQTWFGAIFGIVGLYLLCASGTALSLTLGDALLVICAVFFAVHILIVNRFGDKIYSLRFAFTQYVVCTILNGLCTLIFEEFSLTSLSSGIIPVLYCGIGSVGIAYTCQILGQKYSDPTSASVILSTESVFSAIGGAILLNERMTTEGYIGCVLIFIGVLFTQVPMKKLSFLSSEKKHKTA